MGSSPTGSTTDHADLMSECGGLRHMPKPNLAKHVDMHILGPVYIFLMGRGESGWCSDMTSTHGAWRHAGVRFLLFGDARTILWLGSMSTCKNNQRIHTHTHSRTYVHTYARTHASTHAQTCTQIQDRDIANQQYTPTPAPTARQLQAHAA